MKKYILLASAALALASCNDFLDREPLDFAGEESYYKTENDLNMAVTAFYTVLPVNNTNGGNTGIYTEDFTSDDQCSPGVQELLYEGKKRTPDVNDSQWKFTDLRGINFFIHKVYENFDVSDIDKGNMVNHYLGEAYFFRAWEHYRLLRNYGDAPILTAMQGEDNNALVQASKRYPRNEVARYIISQLDTAARLLREAAPQKGRISRRAAYALISRVALYEGTWEKYHAGTGFVPGNSKWPGKDTWPDFQFKAGSPEAEINWFLDKCIEASEKAVAGTTLHNDYIALFNTEDVSAMSEVILARYYASGILAHNASYYLKGGGGNGVTRQAVATYLMANGLPTYASGSGFKGDDNSYNELKNRDPRLAGHNNNDETYTLLPSGRYTGFGIVRAAGYVKDGKDTVYFYKPAITNTGQDRATTGYELSKWVSDDQTMQKEINSTTTAVPIFRSAECMLNYMEAYYERYGNLGGNCDQYWRAIRQRAGVDDDYNKTINKTMLNKEKDVDLAVFSRGVQVDPTLYNIRRERRCELIAEGRRTDDLKRWRSFDSMQNWQPEGINLWKEVYSLYNEDQQNGLSDEDLTTYLRPMQLTSNSIIYNTGYNFPKPHYLEPIPISELSITKVPSTGKSIIYQNPGWPDDRDGIANYDDPNCI